MSGSLTRLLSEYGGFREYWLDNGEGGYAIGTAEETSHYVEDAKVLADEPPGKDFRLAAVIPVSVMDRAFREGWMNDKAAWKKWANSPDNAYLRVWRGRI